MLKEIDVLNKLIERCEYRIKRTEEDKERKVSLMYAIDEVKKSIAVADKVNEELKVLERDLIEYNAKKEEEALAGIYAGIYSAQSIIPESNNIKLRISKESANLVTDDEDELNINLMEGSALRAMLSFFNRDNILENSEYESFAIYDEPLATLSPESSASLSVLFNILGKRKQIILIEQKPEAFSSIENLVKYSFTKVEGKTLIKRVNDG